MLLTHILRNLHGEFVGFNLLLIFEGSLKKTYSLFLWE